MKHESVKYIVKAYLIFISFFILLTIIVSIFFINFLNKTLPQPMADIPTIQTTNYETENEQLDNSIDSELEELNGGF